MMAMVHRHHQKREKNSMSEYSLRFIRGFIAFCILLVLKRSIAYIYVFIRASVAWLPHSALAWVPGIDVLWWVLIILGLGYVVGSEHIAGFCENGYRGIKSSLEKFMHCCRGSHLVVFKLPGSDTLGYGYAYRYARINGTLWTIIYTNACMGMVWGKRYLVPSDAVSPLTMMHTSEPQDNTKKDKL